MKLKTAISHSTPSNPTQEKLKGLPFESATELKKAQEQILREVWGRLEQARALNELIGRPEYAFWRAEFRSGLTCGYGDKKGQLVRVFSEGEGIQVDIDKDLASKTPSSENILGVLVRSLSESFPTTYYKAKGIIPLETSDKEEGLEAYAPSKSKRR